MGEAPVEGPASRPYVSWCVCGVRCRVSRVACRVLCAAVSRVAYLSLPWWWRLTYSTQHSSTGSNTAATGGVCSELELGAAGWSRSSLERLQPRAATATATACARRARRIRARARVREQPSASAAARLCELRPRLVQKVEQQRVGLRGPLLANTPTPPGAYSRAC
jgi:hypothetical protein